MEEGKRSSQLQIIIIKMCPKNIHCLSVLTFRGGSSGKGGLGGLKNKLVANNNNAERSTRAEEKKKHQNKKKKLPSVIILATGMLQSGRETVSLSSSSFPTLSPIFLGGPFFFSPALQKKGANHAQYCLLRFIFLGRNFHLLSRAVNARLIAAIIPADK